jgi:hypothetical protein
VDSPPLRRWPTALGLLLVTPGLLFVAANVLKFGLGFPGLYDALGPAVAPGSTTPELLQAAVVVGGALAALFLSIFHVARFGLRRHDGELTGSVTLRLRWPSLLVAGLSLALLGSIGLYLIAENLI